MGLAVSVLRSAGGDCTNNGLTSRFDIICIVNIPGPDEPCHSTQPAAHLIEGNLSGTAIVVPEECGTDHVMMGGNYVATSDSRFRSAVKGITGHRFYGAIPVHDRREF